MFSSLACVFRRFVVVVVVVVDVSGVIVAGTSGVVTIIAQGAAVPLLPADNSAGYANNSNAHGHSARFEAARSEFRREGRRPSRDKTVLTDTHIRRDR